MLSGTTLTIVGRHAFQTARLKPDERIYLQRETNNPHDANAIAAYKTDGQIIGHVRRKVAAVIAPNMGVNERAYGSVHSGHAGRWKCSVLLE